VSPYRALSPLARQPEPPAIEPAPQVPAERARVRDALRVLAYAVEQGWAVVRPKSVEVFAADLELVEQQWLLDGIGLTQTRTGLVPHRVTIEGTLIGQLIRVHLPETAAIFQPASTGRAR